MTPRPVAPPRRSLPAAQWECPACQQVQPVPEEGDGLTCCACNAVAVPDRRSRLLRRLAETEREREALWAQADDLWGQLKATYGRIDGVHAAQARLAVLLRKAGVSVPGQVDLYGAVAGEETDE